MDLEARLREAEDDEMRWIREKAADAPGYTTFEIALSDLLVRYDALLRRLSELEQSFKYARPMYRTSELGKHGHPNVQEWVVSDSVRRAALSEANK